MKFTKQELNEIKIPANNVLVKPIVDNSTIKIADIEIVLNTTFTPGRHVETICEVVMVCDRLTPSLENGIDSNLNGVRFGGPIDVLPGDEVLVDFKAVHNALRGEDYNTGKFYNGKMIDVEGEVHIMVKYDELYCAKRKGEIITLNGWNIMQRLDVKHHYGIEIPESVKGEQSERFGKIIYPAKPIIYYEEDMENIPENNQLLQSGDIVLFRYRKAIETEYSQHVAFFDDVMFRIQMKNIFMVLPKQESEYVS